MKLEAEWFGSTNIDQSYITKHNIQGQELMTLLEESWNCDGSGGTGGGYPFWTHVLQGRCKLAIGGNPGSSHKMLEMIFRVGVLLGKIQTPKEAYILTLASIAALAGKHNADFSSLHTYDDPVLDSSPCCYCTNLRSAEPSTKKQSFFKNGGLSPLP